MTTKEFEAIEEDFQLKGENTLALYRFILTILLIIAWLLLAFKTPIPFVKMYLKGVFFVYVLSQLIRVFSTIKNRKIILKISDLNRLHWHYPYKRKQWFFRQLIYNCYAVLVVSIIFMAFIFGLEMAFLYTPVLVLTSTSLLVLSISSLCIFKTLRKDFKEKKRLRERARKVALEHMKYAQNPHSF